MSSKERAKSKREALDAARARLKPASAHIGERVDTRPGKPAVAVNTESLRMEWHDGNGMNGAPEAGAAAGAGAAATAADLLAPPSSSAAQRQPPSGSDRPLASSDSSTLPEIPNVKPLPSFDDNLDRGIAAFQRKEYPTAVAYFRHALKKAKQPDEYSDAYGNLGTVLMLLGDYENALIFHARDLVIAEKNGDKISASEAHENLATVYTKMKNPSVAVRHYEKRVELAKETLDEKVLTNAYRKLGECYFELGSYLQAIETHKKHLDSARRNRNVNEEIIALQRLVKALERQGTLCRAKKKFSKALEYHTLVCDIAVETSDPMTEGRGAFHVALDYLSWGRHDSALEPLSRALLRAREIQTQTGSVATLIIASQLEMETLFQLGYSFLRQREWERSVKCYAGVLGMIAEDDPPSSSRAPQEAVAHSAAAANSRPDADNDVKDDISAPAISNSQSVIVNMPVDSPFQVNTDGDAGTAAPEPTGTEEADAEQPERSAEHFSPAAGDSQANSSSDVRAIPLNELNKEEASPSAHMRDESDHGDGQPAENGRTGSLSRESQAGSDSEADEQATASLPATASPADESRGTAAVSGASALEPRPHLVRPPRSLFTSNAYRAYAKRAAQFGMAVCHYHLGNYSLSAQYFDIAARWRRGEQVVAILRRWREDVHSRVSRTLGDHDDTDENGVPVMDIALESAQTVGGSGVRSSMIIRAAERVKGTEAGRPASLPAIPEDGEENGGRLVFSEAMAQRASPMPLTHTAGSQPFHAAVTRLRGNSGDVSSGDGTEGGKDSEVRSKRGSFLFRRMSISSFLGKKKSNE